MSKSSRRRNRKNRPNSIASSPTPHGTIATDRFIAVGATYSGPIPPPEMMAQYNAIIPDGADRILKMAESQSAHRQSIELTVINSDVQRSRLGLAAGFMVVTIAIITGGCVAVQGQPWAGASIAAAPSAALIGVFIYGTSSRSSERIEKSKTS